VERDNMVKGRRLKIDNLVEDYAITVCGKLYNLSTKKWIKPTIKNGYKYVNLSAYGDSQRHYSIHRLVAMTFIPNPNNLQVVDHINNDPLDNRVENLQWLTQKQNINRSTKKTSHERKVIKLDKDTLEELETYDSITDAAESIDKTRRAIQLVLNGKNKTAGGYKWKYVEHGRYKKVYPNLNCAIKIKGFEKYYVYPDGRIYNILNKSYLEPVKNANGNVYVTLCKPGVKKQNWYINRIVANHFLSDFDMSKRVIHINGIKDDNRVENLKCV
jgi:hypothetical protein